MKLKICGMKYADNISEVAKLAPDFMGFIFYEKSKRYVGDDFLLPQISSEIKKVGVFVNESETNILDMVHKYKFDYLQLHGDENVEFCKRVSHSVKIIKAFGIDEQFDFSVLNRYENYCEYFLFDKKTNEYGGSGKPFDKNILKKYKLSKSYFLSGGIGLDEISELRTQNPKPFAMDVNSKFEIKPGLKEIYKLKILITSLRGTE